ncbi:Uma2 family endonuclease [Methylomonas rapida]|uniref:Uma2 family endonuclease n=1 Tax=Methylomonas rapida TaxID=2963939 RepID=A0ABY7GFX5_9GAMM|nr:Uma2 family endonuclease [Methylomonas rapida]WAR43136.1 Uma2 family endonuclease [Methylomonas rapida]
MSAQPKFDKPWKSIEDYLAGELDSDLKHEYIDGQIYAMTGGSINHERIALNMATELRNHLRGKPCEAFGSNVKIKTDRHVFYPDAMVVCNQNYPSEYYTDSPVLVVEVLSKSTRRLDETVKRRVYQSIPTLLEYVLLEQDIVDVEICRRSEGWVSNHYFLGDEVHFQSVGLTLSVADIYARVDNDDVRTFIAVQQAAKDTQQA